MISKHFGRFSLYIAYLFFISYKMHLVELRCSEVLVCTVIISLVRSAGRTNNNNIKDNYIICFILEIDRYIDLPIFFTIFKHFTIIVSDL